MTTTANTAPLLRMSAITKSFGSVRVLDGVELTVPHGEVHGLLGENGAGKSTLLNILNGVVQRDGGTVEIDAVPVAFSTPKQAQDSGLALIHQELSLLPQLSVAENVLLGRMPLRSKYFVDWRACNKQAADILDRLGLDIDPRTLVGRLGTAEQEVVEIAKALSMDARLIAMDEPTASLTEAEIERLFTLMRSLTAQGVSILYVSHRLHEVAEICDRATILRDGRMVDTVDAKRTTPHQLATMMVGRELDRMFPKSEVSCGPVSLRVSHLSNAKLRDVSFTAHEGEILGIAGLIGSGRTELARALFGADPIDSGEVFVGENRLRLSSPRAAIRNGLGFVPEDRKLQGAVLSMSTNHNMTLASLRAISRFGRLDRRRERQIGRRFLADMHIVPPRLDYEVGHLSGGNQQKVVLAKWLCSSARIFIVDEPSRGVDVGARAAIHGLLDELAQQGRTVIMISSDLLEVIGMSDRILVMHEGRIAGELSRAEATEEAIVTYASGLEPATEGAAQ
ncbi:MAG TPA: sugar ABC transporter ATP-binding protein [Pseudonocardiaceae bacterium]|nr:sugar ABC transporter ATP-binding protein [Pseudonocardiaceae bacterium]